MTLNRISIVGISENYMNPHINIYPNPAKDFIVLDFNEFHGKINRLNILNIQGQNLFTIDIIGQSQELNVPLANLKDGFYLLQLKTSNGDFIKKIIVRK